MADTEDRLEITPRVIETATRVIQMPHVTSAGFGTAHPFRPVGLGMIALGAVLIGVEVISSGVGAFTISKAGSPMLWVAFAAAGVGLFLSVFAKRYLVIRTVDGARFNLPAGDEEASAMVIGRIRTAMESGERSAAASGQTAPLAIGVDPATQARTSLTPRSLPATTAPSGRGIVPAEPRAPQASQTQPLGHARRPEGYVNGHGSYGGAPTRGGDGHGEPGERGEPRRGLSEFGGQARAAGEPATGGYAGGAGGEAMQPATADPFTGGNPPDLHTAGGLGQVAPLREDPADDLKRLIDHVRHADVQHKEALLDLLRVVDEHYRGRASREDAVAHWRSFSDYVEQYLNGVDGLLDHTKRFGRHIHR